MIEEGFIGWKELEKLVPVERMTIWRWEGEGRFPRRVQLGRNRIAWRRAEVNKWMAERPTIMSTGGRHLQDWRKDNGGDYFRSQSAMWASQHDSYRTSGGAYDGQVNWYRQQGRSLH